MALFEQALKVVLCALLAGLISCKKNEHHEEVYEVSIDEVPVDFKVPSKLWDFIEGKNAVAVDPHHSPVKEAEGFSNPSNINFTFVDVILTEKNSKVLVQPEIKIRFPRGGGEIDLSNYMGSRAGTFYVNFVLPEIAEGTNTKLFFVSKAKKRKVDNVVYGAGCNQFFDITSKFFSESTKLGIQANSTRDRHATLLGGRFVFFQDDGKQIMLTQVGFKDSQRKDLFCD